MTRKPYPSDVSDEEWIFAAPYLALIDDQAPQRRYSLREVFNALCWLARGKRDGVRSNIPTFVTDHD